MVDTQLAFTCVKQQAGTNFRKENDDESGTESDTAQTIATSVEDSTETYGQSSSEDTHEHGDSKTEGVWGKANFQSVHSPPLVSDSPIILNNEQKVRLRSLLNEVVMINGNGGSNTKQQSLPTLKGQVVWFLNILLKTLEIFDIWVIDVRLHGGAASHVISDTWPSFNDIDILIHVDFKSFEQRQYLARIKSAVLESLRQILTNDYPGRQTQIPTANIDDETLASAYIAKMFMYLGSSENLDSDENNIFSFFSFNANGSRSIDIMFVLTLRRQCLFSIDSWQIDLSDFRSYCLYPDKFLAFEDMENELIRVFEPETVRGGCFLPYGYWLYRGYMLPSDVCDIEQGLVMLNRFLSDFDNKSKQKKALVGYLENHLESHPLEQKIKYLELLDRIVDHLNRCRKLPNAASTLSAVIKSKLNEFLNQQIPVSIQG